MSALVVRTESLARPDSRPAPDSRLAPDSRPASIDLRHECLHRPAHEFLSRCGKRIRAVLVNESFRAAGGDGQPCVEISEAIEWLHAGSLIIDDIEDDSQQRRGEPTLHRQIGLPLAINTGNWMYFSALEKLSAAPIDPLARQRIVLQTIRSVARCHEGQALDLGVAVDQIPSKQIHPTARSISRWKTGGLTALAAWVGATAAGGDQVTAKAIRRFGMNVGVCLQMHNDLAELQRFVDGEPRCDDLRNARVTWPWAWAEKLMRPDRFETLRARLHHSPTDVVELRRIAHRLIEVVGEGGRALIDKRLHREMALLSEHVESTSGFQTALNQLRTPKVSHVDSI